MFDIGFGAEGELLQARTLELQAAIDEGERRGPQIDEARRILHERHLRTLHHLLGEAEAALSKVKDGSYGRCDACDQPIAREELERDPATTICPTCRDHHPGWD